MMHPTMGGPNGNNVVKQQLTKTPVQYFTSFKKRSQRV